MDLLVEKLDGSRYYLSQYKVLITEFEESAPTVTRNSTQLDQRNGNIDFGGWHTDKTIDITGYYRADDMDEEETLREKLYALLSDPNGYYITQLKTTPSVAMERPGETSGGYYDKLKDYPSHKRFLVYTEAPEMELVGNVNGTLLYKLTAEFKTMVLPYGETKPRDVSIDTSYVNVPKNLLTGTNTQEQSASIDLNNWNVPSPHPSFSVNPGDQLVYRILITSKNTVDLTAGIDAFSGTTWKATYTGNVISAGASGYSRITFTVPSGVDNIVLNNCRLVTRNPYAKTQVYWRQEMLNYGTLAYPWAPNAADALYYSYIGNTSVPYVGTVPCNQLEQRFALELVAKQSASSLVVSIDDTQLTSSNPVSTGDVILLNGFSYTQNGLSIVSKTNKAFFVLHPDKPNLVTCNLPCTIRVLGFQNLYA